MAPQDIDTAIKRAIEQGTAEEEQNHLLAHNSTMNSPDVDIEEFDDGTDQRFYCLITGANRYTPYFFLFSFFFFSFFFFFSSPYSLSHVV